MVELTVHLRLRSDDGNARAGRELEFGWHTLWQCVTGGSGASLFWLYLALLLLPERYWEATHLQGFRSWEALQAAVLAEESQRQLRPVATEWEALRRTLQQALGTGEEKEAHAEQAAWEANRNAYEAQMQVLPARYPARQRTLAALQPVLAAALYDTLVAGSWLPGVYAAASLAEFYAEIASLPRFQERIAQLVERGLIRTTDDLEVSLEFRGLHWTQRGQTTRRDVPTAMPWL
jgi:hypothetical protein